MLCVGVFVFFFFFLLFVLFFFFQAEDGIRDLVRSRGLGDVYKRQVVDAATSELGELLWIGRLARDVLAVSLRVTDADDVGAVSYTHLTLPTSDLV